LVATQQPGYEDGKDRSIPLEYRLDLLRSKVDNDAVLILDYTSHARWPEALTAHIDGFTGVA
jgi:hypothetical protein